VCPGVHGGQAFKFACLRHLRSLVVSLLSISLSLCGFFFCTKPLFPWGPMSSPSSSESCIYSSLGGCTSPQGLTVSTLPLARPCPASILRDRVPSCLTQAGVRLEQPHNAAGYGVDEHGILQVAPCILLLTSDAGSDMASATRQLAAKLRTGEDTKHIGVIGQLCLQHQLHLAVARSLARADRHLPNLAKLVHLWRASGMAIKFRVAFEQQYGSELARRVAATPPPVPLRGRWGSAHASEERVLRCERSQLRNVPGPRLPGHRGAEAFRRCSAPCAVESRESWACPPTCDCPGEGL
jgi:hypothetical protein